MRISNPSFVLSLLYYFPRKNQLLLFNPVIAHLSTRFIYLSHFRFFIFWQKPHVRLNFPSKSVYLNAYQRNISFWISTVTQRLDQINSSIASNNTTTPENIRSDLLISAFEQSEIHNTLEHTRLKSTQLTHIPNLEKIPASTKRIKP